MGFVISLILIAFGAILTWAVHSTSGSVDVNVVGVILMVVGIVVFARAFFEQGKPVGVICHGPWMLVEAGVVRGREVTSWPSLRTDIRNAGGNWVDKEVVVDQGLVTSRKPDDIPAFNKKLVEEF